MKNIEDLNREIEKNPNNYNAYLQRGLIYIEDLDAGVVPNTVFSFKDYSKAIEINPNCANAYVNRAEIYKFWGEIFAEYQSSSKNPDWLVKATYHLKIDLSQCYLMAIADYTKALKINPNDVDTQQARARLMQKLFLI
ncbi:tetratricopeptide repeat protein [Anabaena sp. WFMT]|uniref:tetratricopeptide repeat protein n=1 Tax=Anabaena sp. WFMT TaxID=3449730 RepID=UPI003F27EACE